MSQPGSGGLFNSLQPNRPALHPIPQPPSVPQLPPPRPSVTVFLTADDPKLANGKKISVEAVLRADPTTDLYSFSSVAAAWSTKHEHLSGFNPRIIKITEAGTNLTAETDEKLDAYITSSSKKPARLFLQPFQHAAAAPADAPAGKGSKPAAKPAKGKPRQL